MRRTATLIATGLLALVLAACGGQAAPTTADNNQAEEASTQEPMPEAEEDEEPALPAIPADVTGGKPWMDSVVVGNVTAKTQTSPVDDLYLYVNKDWIIAQELPEGSETLDFDKFAESRARVQAALTGADLKDHDARQAQLLLRTFVNTDARDAAGCEPAKKVVDEIRSLKSVDEVSAFLLDVERSAGVPTLVRVLNSRDYESHRWATTIRLSNPTFGNSSETMGMNAENVDTSGTAYKARLALVTNVLTRMGYTEDEAEAAFQNRLGLEKELIRAAAEAPSDEAQSYSLDQLDGLAGGFPLRTLAEARGYGQAKEFEVESTADLHAAGTVYNDEHLDALRDYLICGYVIEAGGWLDTEAFKAWLADYDANEGHVSLTMPERNESMEEMAVNLESVILPTPLGRAYVEGADLAHTKEFMESFCNDAVETHKQLVNDCAWLSDASKKRMTEKLDAITMQLVYPDEWEDYSGLDLNGLSYYAARKAIWLNDLARDAALTNTEVNDRLWQKPSLIEGGGAYDFDTNSFHVDAGVCEGDIARYEAGEMTLSEFLGGGVGYIVFHEIGHALDTNNVFFDAKGNDLDSSLLEPDDLKEFELRTNKIKEYLDGITIWEGQNVQGEVCEKEAMAEICGMQARLAYAAKQDSFDYQAFFEERARLQPSVSTAEYEQQWVYGGDSHPVAFLDTNVTVQQFDEFMDAFGVKEGDAMWLAPKDRLVVW